jgi:ligand-binding sensor domain-containing protein
MHADGAGRVWVLTMAGLNRIDGTRFTAFTRAQGMPESEMGWLLEDDDGYFWIASRGMLRVSKADLNAVAEGRKRAVEPQQFGAADGIAATSCTLPPTAACWRSTRRV